MVKPLKDIYFPIEGVEETDHHYDIYVFDGAKGICDGGYREYIINVPKDIVSITEFLDVHGCIENKLAICPRCGDTKNIKISEHKSTKMTPIPLIDLECIPVEYKIKIKEEYNSYNISSLNQRSLYNFFIKNNQRYCLENVNSIINTLKFLTC
jgi:hypothetical protein